MSETHYLTKVFFFFLIERPLMKLHRFTEGLLKKKTQILGALYYK